MKHSMQNYINIILLIIFFLLPNNLFGKSDTARVVRVVDGDTLKILYRGKTESVRLIGIDTPESRINRKTERDAERSNRDIKIIISEGKKATRFVMGLVGKGDIIRIEFDAERRDRYSRLLCYVYLPDGRMLNEVIIWSGYASPMTIPPNVKHRDIFLKGYRYARKNRLGLWK